MLFSIGILAFISSFYGNEVVHDPVSFSEKHSSLKEKNWAQTGSASKGNYETKRKQYEAIADAYNAMGRFIPAEDNGSLNGKGNSKIQSDFDAAFHQAEASIRSYNPLAPAFGYTAQRSPRAVRQQMYENMRKAYQEALDAQYGTRQGKHHSSVKHKELVPCGSSDKQPSQGSIIEFIVNAQETVDQNAKQFDAQNQGQGPINNGGQTPQGQKHVNTFGKSAEEISQGQGSANKGGKPSEATPHGQGPVINIYNLGNRGYSGLSDYKASAKRIYKLQGPQNKGVFGYKASIKNKK